MKEQEVGKKLRLQLGPNRKHLCNGFGHAVWHGARFLFERPEKTSQQFAGTLIGNRVALADNHSQATNSLPLAFIVRRGETTAQEANGSCRSCQGRSAERRFIFLLNRLYEFTLPAPSRLL